jgi:hypothetical protein
VYESFQAFSDAVDYFREWADEEVLVTGGGEAFGWLVDKIRRIAPEEGFDVAGVAGLFRSGWPDAYTLDEGDCWRIEIAPVVDEKGTALGYASCCVLYDGLVVSGFGTQVDGQATMG